MRLPASQPEQGDGQFPVAASGPDSDEDYELIEIPDFELDDLDDCAESDEGGGWDSESDSDD